MANKAAVPFLVAMMLLTGVCNTLLTKYQDMQCVANCSSKDPKQRRYFEQPVIQTAQMFVGEMGCWLVIAAYKLYIRYSPSAAAGAHVKNGHIPVPTERDPLLATTPGPEDDEDEEDLEEDPLATSLTLPHDERCVPLKGWKVVYLALPACCDIAGTTLMNVGLLFVAASIYQMTRGALVLFVGLFSVIFLKRYLGLYKWFALFVVVAGVALVGLAGALDKKSGAVADSLIFVLVKDPKAAAEANPALRTIIGVALIACAQIFTAAQFVIEESIMSHYAIEPLAAVGWEGTWGFLVTVLGMVIAYFSYGRTEAGRGGYFDLREGLWEVGHYRAISVSSVLIMISIGGFNFFGLSVTRSVSATSRSTIDTCRTLFIWIISLGLGWETFKWLQVAGFALLVYGTFLFNGIVRPPLAACRGREEEEEEQ